jgi:hypothetical protein
MKKYLFVCIAISLFFEMGIAQNQNEKALPVTTIKEEGPWASGIEARNIAFDGRILDAMYTMLSNSTEVDSVVKNASYLTYITSYKDRVYFILSQGSSPSRVLVISRIPVTGIGVITRLDNEMLQAAHYFASCVEGKEQDIFNIFAGNTGKFYYTAKRGQYTRIYLDQTVNSVVSGYLVIPKNSNIFCFRYAEYKTSKCQRYSVNLKFQDQEAASYIYNRDKQGFNMHTIYAENKAPGTYIFTVTFNWTYGQGCPPEDRFRVWFECFGDELNETISVGDNPQPFLQSRPFAELKLPR